MKKEFFAYSKYAAAAVAGCLSSIVNRHGRLPVVVCLGTDRVLADCFGPVVGSKLLAAGLPIFVYGSLQRPVTAIGMKYCLQFVRALHPHLPVWIVDAQTSFNNKFGVITVADEFQPYVKAAEPCPQADLYITAAVSQADKTSLRGAALSVIDKAAEVISNAILLSINNTQRTGSNCRPL
ncbi:MAG: spore protease YyaC [Firmicutes bacterium]|nr:spore protease YyaC [Bacillota bacterium]